jgi:hypothetical protein
MGVIFKLLPAVAAASLFFSCRPAAPLASPRQDFRPMIPIIPETSASLADPEPAPF